MKKFLYKISANHRDVTVEIRQNKASVDSPMSIELHLNRLIMNYFEKLVIFMYLSK